MQLEADELDLREIEARLYNGQYKNAHEFATDIRKLWSNGFRHAKGDKERANDFKQLAEYSERFLVDLPNLPIYRD